MLKPAQKKAKDCLILAVDTAELKEACQLLDELHEYVGIFKLGLQIFTRYGPETLKPFQQAGAKVFLDLKFHDIPNTVAGAAEQATACGAFMFTVHASGGSAMLKAASKSAKQTADRLNIPEPLILAVTVLTSISQETLSKELNVSLPMSDQVLKLANLCVESDIHGLVASPEEAAYLRTYLKNMILVTPGVRPSWSSTDDQSRFTTPSQAIKNGSDYLVIGRPITKAPDRKDAGRRIIEEIESALA